MRQTSEEFNNELQVALSLSAEEARTAEAIDRSALESSLPPFHQEKIAAQQSRAAHAQHGGGCHFWFVKASKIKDAEVSELPRFQDLQPERHRVSVHISHVEAYRNMFADRLCAVSHCWELKERPDMTGTQLRKIKHFLTERPNIELVWIDWCCMPQKRSDGEDDRSEEQKADFRRMLASVNLLYMASTVLVLLDLGYPGRFWTLFECWLALQRGSEHGLVSAIQGEAFSAERYQYGRAYFMHLHLASRSNAARQQVIDMLGQAEPEEVFIILSSPDVRVTNQSDKDDKLAEVLHLSELVKETLRKE